MHKYQKAAFWTAIEKVNETICREDAMRDLVADMTRQLVLIREDADTARMELQKLYAELNGKEKG